MNPSFPRPRRLASTLAYVGLAALAVSACAGSAHRDEPVPRANPRWIPQASETSASLRGLSVVDARVAWASGSGGTFVRTVDGGAVWHADTVPGAADLDFRDVHAVDANTAYLLSAGEGEQSRIYKTTDGGRSWVLQFTNRAPDGFFDGMAFWDAEHGLAYSDPVDGRFLIVTTADGGTNWTPVPPDRLPPALPGEAGFAASGTGIVVAGRGHAWFGTGGGAISRVFRSVDEGRTWTAAPTTIRAGSASAGIFSLAFRDTLHGVAVGGDYTRPGDARANVAITVDGGTTWTPATGTPPAGYRSGVAWVPGTIALIAVGTSGADYSTDGGENWAPFDAVGFHSIGFDEAQRAGWAVGAEGRIARLVFLERP